MWEDMRRWRGSGHQCDDRKEKKSCAWRDAEHNSQGRNTTNGDRGRRGGDGVATEDQAKRDGAGVGRSMQNLCTSVERGDVDIKVSYVICVNHSLIVAWLGKGLEGPVWDGIWKWDKRWKRSRMPHDRNWLMMSEHVLPCSALSQ